MESRHNAVTLAVLALLAHNCHNTNTTLSSTYQYSNKNTEEVKQTSAPHCINSDYLHKHALSVITTGNKNALNNHTHMQSNISHAWEW